MPRGPRGFWGGFGRVLGWSGGVSDLPPPRPPGNSRLQLEQGREGEVGTGRELLQPCQTRVCPIFSLLQECLITLKLNSAADNTPPKKPQTSQGGPQGCPVPPHVPVPLLFKDTKPPPESGGSAWDPIRDLLRYLEGFGALGLFRLTLCLPFRLGTMMNGPRRMEAAQLRLLLLKKVGKKGSWRSKE